MSNGKVHLHRDARLTNPPPVATDSGWKSSSEFLSRYEMMTCNIPIGQIIGWNPEIKYDFIFVGWMSVMEVELFRYDYKTDN